MIVLFFIRLVFCLSPQTQVMTAYSLLLSSHESSCIHFKNRDIISSQLNLLFNHVEEVLANSSQSHFKTVTSNQLSFLNQVTIEDLLGTLSDQEIDVYIQDIERCIKQGLPVPYCKIDIAYRVNTKVGNILYNAFFFPPGSVTPVHSHTSEGKNEPCVSFCISGQVFENRYQLTHQERIEHSYVIYRHPGDFSVVVERETDLERSTEDIHDIINPFPSSYWKRWVQVLLTWKETKQLNQSDRQWLSDYVGMALHVYPLVSERGSVRQTYVRPETSIEVQIPRNLLTFKDFQPFFSNYVFARMTDSSLNIYLKGSMISLPRKGFNIDVSRLSASNKSFLMTILTDQQLTLSRPKSLTTSLLDRQLKTPQSVDWDKAVEVMNLVSEGQNLPLPCPSSLNVDVCEEVKALFWWMAGTSACPEWMYYQMSLLLSSLGEEREALSAYLAETFDQLKHPKYVSTLIRPRSLSSRPYEGESILFNQSQPVFEDDSFVLDAHHDFIGRVGIDVRPLQERGFYFHDRGLGSTAYCMTDISTVDGRQGRLFYRGQSIEALASQPFDKVATLLKGDADCYEESLEDAHIHFSSEELDSLMVLFQQKMEADEIKPENTFLELYTWCVNQYDQKGTLLQEVSQKLVLLIALIIRIDSDKNTQSVLTISEYLNLLKHNSGGRIASFVSILGQDPDIFLSFWNAIFNLHQSHGQNASSSAARVAIRWGAPPSIALSQAFSTLFGKDHGGANVNVMKMLNDTSIMERAELEMREKALQQLFKKAVARKRVKSESEFYHNMQIDEQNIQDEVNSWSQKYPWMSEEEKELALEKARRRIYRYWIDPINSRIPGLGHRVYQQMDPRAVILKDLINQKINQLEEGEEKNVLQSQYAEILAIEVCSKYYRDFHDGIVKQIYPNVDLFSAPLYKVMRISPKWSSTLFAVQRVDGYAAEILEEQQRGSGIPPSNEFVKRRCTEVLGAPLFCC